MFDLVRLIKDRNKREPRNGWAPGDYVRSCISCEEYFIGDKRAFRCASCAYKKEEVSHGENER